MLCGRGEEICIRFSLFGKPSYKQFGGLNMAKMTKEEAAELARKIIENSKKHGIPMKKKPKK